MLSFVFLTTSLYTKSVTFFKSTETVFDLPISQSSTFVFKLFELVGTLTNLLISNLSTSAFKARKFFSAVKSDVLTPVARSQLFLVA